MYRFRVVSPALRRPVQSQLQSGGGAPRFGSISTVCRRSRLSAIIWINLPSGKGREQQLAMPVMAQAEECALAKNAKPTRICGEAGTPAPPLTREVPANKRKVRTRPTAEIPHPN